MRFVAIFLTAALGLSGCTKKTSVNKEGASTHLSDVQWRVAKLSEVTWKVGRTLRDIVTRNLTVVVELPPFAQEDEEFLAKTYGIDSWLVRITQITAASARIELGTLHVPFRGVTKGRGGGLPVRSVSFSLTYAAAAMSERFRRFNCPAFSHDRRLGDYDVIGDEKPIEIIIVPAGTYSEKLKPNELVPTTYNIGHTMVGEYAVEVALLNSNEKKMYSQFQELPFHIKVHNEKTETVEGCAGVHEEFEPAKENSTRGFMRGGRMSN